MLTRLSEYLTTLILNQKLPIHIQLYYRDPKYSSETEKKLIQRAIILGKNLEIKKIGDNRLKFIYILDKYSIKGKIFNYNETWITVIEPSKAASRIIDSFTRTSYPILVPLRLNTKAFGNFLKSLEPYSITKELLYRKKGTSKKWKKGREKLSVQKVLYTEDGILQAIRICFKTHLSWMDLRITRHGRITIYNATENLYPELNNYILDPYIKLAYNTISDLTKVKIYILEGKEPKPNPKVLHFKNKFIPEDYDTLIKNLQKNFYTNTVYKGNPWLHVEVIDKNDGTNYQIIIDEKMVTIIPGYKTAPSSLQVILDILQDINPFLEEG